MKKVSVIGIGRLGICFSLTLEKCGYQVLGVDINEKYVSSINNKTLVSDEQGVEEHLLKSTNFRATTNIKAALDYSDVLYVVVATPSLPDGKYDHSQVDSVVNKLLTYGNQSGKHLVICCTTMPGYSDTVAEKMADFGYTVSYNPEFIAQGTVLRDQASPDMVLIGEGSKEAGDIMQEMYEKMTINSPRIHRMSRTEAEITKIGLNCFLTTKISYANMVGDIVLRAGGDPSVVLSAIGADTRIGNKYLGYGYGYGGPCFPRDNRALAIFAKDLEIDALISLASDKSNEKHLEYQLDYYEQNNDKSKQICFSTVTYKPESTMIVESQQLAYAVGLAKRGFDVLVKERQAVVDQVKDIYGDLLKYEVV
jgi:UDPglucose 6-dehydrogenase